MSYDRGNIWNQQYHSDDSDVVRRGTQPFSLTGIQGVKLGNGDVFYLCSASAGGAITVNLPSATKNTGAVHFIKLRSTGDVIASTAGGTIQGSATLSASGAFMALRSNGVDWWPEGGGVPDPLNVGVLNAGSVSISANLIVGGVATMGGFGVLGDSRISGTLSVGHIALEGPGSITSITGGAEISYASDRLYEMSLGAGDEVILLPDPATTSGRRATVKIKATGGGQVLLTGHIEGSATVSATVTVSGALSVLNLIAGQSTWWRA